MLYWFMSNKMPLTILWKCDKLLPHLFLFKINEQFKIESYFPDTLYCKLCTLIFFLLLFCSYYGCQLFVHFISTGKLVIGFMKMIVVSHFFINSIYIIFNIVHRVHTNFYHCERYKRKDFPVDKMQDEFSSCRTQFLCPALRPGKQND
jgi:hypothetical protein